MTNVTFTGWGACVPPSVLTNDDLSTIVETLSLIHISEPTRPVGISRMPSSA